MDKPEEECESADPSLKGTMAPPPSPNHGIVLGIPSTTAPGDNLVTIVSTPPLASAEHVSCLFFLSNIGRALALPMGVAPESICD